MIELKPGDQVVVEKRSHNEGVVFTAAMVVGPDLTRFEGGFYNANGVWYSDDEWRVVRHDPKPAVLTQPCIGAILRVLEQHGSSEWRTTVFVRESDYRWLRTGILDGFTWEMVQNYLSARFVKKVEVFADGND